jgi:hypothetical protein
MLRTPSFTVARELLLPPVPVYTQVWPSGPVMQSSALLQPVPPQLRVIWPTVVDPSTAVTLVSFPELKA